MADPDLDFFHAIFLGKTAMRRKLYLHIGPHKTGTTALQRALHGNARYLVNNGYYYPVNGRGVGRFGENEFGHHMYADAIVNNKESRAVLMLEKEIRSVPWHIILSSENFIWHRNPRALYDRLHDFDIFVVFFIRRQDELIESFYQQQIKDFYPKNTNTISEFIKKRQPKFLDFFQLWALWSRGLSKGRVRACLYSASEKEDSITLFLNTIGLAVPEWYLPKKIENQKSSIPPEALEVARFLKERTFDHDEYNAEISHLLRIAFDACSPFDRSMSLLNIDDRKRLLSRYAESNEKVFRELKLSPQELDDFQKLEIEKAVFRQDANSRLDVLEKLLRYLMKR